MFGIGLPELILILGVALIVVGPEKLPEMAKSMARVVLDFKKMASELKDNLHEEMREGVGDAYPNLAAPADPDPATPEVDAVSPPEANPVLIAAQPEIKEENAAG
ncbi:MAG: hypothetical protein A2505_07220 [Deltaproteobacteria bacterium RIFOXYD12_FULL_55_16]|nr:MAG: hypothetical protein A2505_07220 [Deltaproteobacteria bacterium RIFOXYD12_FULL_55_16]